MYKHVLDFFFSLMIALVIVFIGSNISDSFFFMDDAQNEFLPFMREIGRTWLSGEVPFVLENTYFGSNMLIDLHRAIFLPQSIALAVLSVKIDSVTLIANIYAAFNITIISFSAIKASKALGLTSQVAVIVACLFSISPIFLYFYLESWWNGAIGQSWFVAALASILHLRNRFTSFNLFMNCIAVYSILVSGWPHAAVAYAILAGLFCLEMIWDKKYRDLFIFIFLSMGLIFIIIPIYSEYLTSSDLIGRVSQINNNDNFLSTTLNQILFTFNPVYYHFMHRFGGYDITNISIAYSSIYILISLCFVDIKTALKDRNVVFIGFLSLVFFILNQTPTHLGPLRWVFRFTPFFTEALIIFSVILLTQSLIISKNRIFIFIGFIVLSSILGIFSQENRFGFILLIQIIFIFCTLVYLWDFLTNKQIRLFSSLLYTLICAGLMLIVQPGALGYLSMPGVKSSINYENDYSKGGYLLSLTNGREPKDHVEDLNSAQFLLFGLKAVNGATPVGNNLVSEVLNVRSSQAYFEEEKTITNLSQTFDGVCKFDLYNIDTIVMNRETINDNIRANLVKCGFEHKPVRNQFVDFFIKSNFVFRASVSYLSPNLFNFSVLEDKRIREKYKVSSNDAGIMTFSRVFWHGYKVTLNGEALEVLPQDGILKVNIPAGIKDGIIELSYFPRSWHYSLWIALVGIILLITILFLNWKYRIEKDLSKNEF